VGEAIRDELSQLIARSVHDPGVGFLTLTKVNVTSDLQLARVYYTTMGDEQARRETAKALKRAMPFLRRQVAQRIRLRRVPELEFFYDESIAQHDRIERILQELRTESASRGEDPAGSEPRERSADQEGAAATEPRERSGARGVPASERAGGPGGAKPPGLVMTEGGR
jgi:ribosome-binding factor A